MCFSQRYELAILTYLCMHTRIEQKSKYIVNSKSQISNYQRKNKPCAIGLELNWNYGLIAFNIYIIYLILYKIIFYTYLYLCIFNIYTDYT